MNVKYIILLILTIQAGLINGQGTDQKKITKDIKFAKTAAEDGLMEVKLGELAQTNAMNAEVKGHGKTMITDHGKANGELKALAAKKSIELPSGVDAKKQERYDKLSKLKGKEFDKKYAKCMVKDHKKAVCLFKKESKKGKDPELKAWASGKLPTLKHHLHMWKETCKAL